jgi:hypothetical protein
MLWRIGGLNKIKRIKAEPVGSHADTRDMYMVHTTFGRSAELGSKRAGELKFNGTCKWQL